MWDAEADAPAAGATVRVDSAGGVIAEMRTDQSGVFAFESAGDHVIAAGTYRIVVQVSGRRVERALVVAPNEPVTLVGRVDV